MGKCLENNDWDCIRLDLDKRPIESISGKSSEQDILNILSKYGIMFLSDQKVQITLWGSGNVYREFLYVEDMADACVYIIENVEMDTLYKNYKLGFINIGSGKDITIKELAYLVQTIVGFKGHIMWNIEKPDGTPKKLMDSSLLENLGWHHKVQLPEGISSIYQNY